MMFPTQRICCLALCAVSLAVAAVAAAQDAPTQTTPAAPAKPAAQSSAQIDAGEPRANTSAPPPASSTAEPSAPVGAAAPAAGSVAPKGHSKVVAGASRETAKGAKTPGGADRLDLGTATVTGDREQPKVMYIVPWKKSDIGDLSGKPMNSLLDEALAPVDRDEFKREVAYFDAVKADTSQNGPANGAAKQVEK